LENWISGKPLDPHKSDEIIATIDWLFAFQNKNRRTTMTKGDVHLEVNMLKTNLLQIPHLNKQQYRKWLDDFESYASAIHVDKTSEHGDFWHKNILINPETNEVNVIDWEHFREEGNPFFDLIFMLINAMQLPGNPINEFKCNLDGYGRFATILKELKNKIDNHFGFSLDLDILIRYTMLRFVIRIWLERGPYNETVILYNKLLDSLASKF
ncbi:MAG: phosphotransferase family protein, partial [Nitrososphaeraceae archaeon]